MVLTLLVIHMLQRGIGDFRESGSHHDSVLLPNVPLQRDYEKHHLSLESVSSECLLIVSHTSLIEVNEILCHTDWSKYRRTYW